MAKQGLKPFVAIYSTFLQRAYDEIVEDVCLQNLPVVFCIDRAGVVGEDGETHHGIFDISYLKNLPNMTMLAPSNAEMLERSLDFAAEMGTPCAIRYPRGTAAKGERFNVELGKSHEIRSGKDAVIWAFGSMVENALEAAEILSKEGIECGVIDGMFIKPLDTFGLYKSAAEYPLMVTVEDGVVTGGIGESIKALLSENATKVINLGWPEAFIEHGSQKKLQAHYKLDAEGIAESIRKGLSS